MRVFLLSHNHRIGSQDSPSRFYHNGTYPNHVLMLSKTPARFGFDGREVVLPPNQVVLYRRWDLMNYSSVGDGLLHDWIRFDAVDDAEEDWLDRLPVAFCRPVPLRQFWSLSAEIEQMTRLFYSDSPYRAEELDLRMRLLLIQIAREHQTIGRSAAVNANADALLSLRNRLHADPCAFSSVADAAAQVGFSVSYFQHLYQNLFHVSWVDDRNRSRVERACQLLENTDKTVGEIAASAGFGSEMNLYRCFKRIVGATPAGYRAAAFTRRLSAADGPEKK